MEDILRTLKKEETGGAVGIGRRLKERGAKNWKMAISSPIGITVWKRGRTNIETNWRFRRKSKGAHKKYMEGRGLEVRGEVPLENWAGKSGKGVLWRYRKGRSLAPMYSRRGRLPGSGGDQAFVA